MFENLSITGEPVIRHLVVNDQNTELSGTLGPLNGETDICKELRPRIGQGDESSNRFASRANLQVSLCYDILFDFQS